MLSLSFSSKQSLIYSAGFDREIFVWDAVLAAQVACLSGHSAPLIGVAPIESENQFVSGGVQHLLHRFVTRSAQGSRSNAVVCGADVSGTFRLWDSRSFQCLQVFSNRKLQRSGMFSFVMTQNPRRIIAGGRRLHFFE